LQKRIISLIFILVVVFSASWGFPQQEVSHPPAAGLVQETSGATPAAAPKAKEDDRLFIQKEEWLFIVAPYMWIPGINMNTTLLGQTTSVNQGWWDMVPKLFSNTIGVMGRAEVWKGDWGIFVDSYYMYLGGSDSDNRGKILDLGRRQTIPVSLVLNGNLKFITRAANVDFGPRYLLGTVKLRADKPLPVLSIEALAGGRYNNYSQYMKLNVDATLTGPLQTRTAGGSFVSKISRSFLEPMLGMRLGLWLTPKALVSLRATVGGFGFASDNNLDSDMELSFGYKVQKHTYAYIGYRAHSVSAKSDDFSLNTWIHGPVLGAAFVF
jgi:hypothetical protein